MPSSPSSWSRALRRAAAATLATLLGAAVVHALPAAPAGADVTQLRGVQLHSLWNANTTADVDQQLDLVAASGSSVARLDVAWSSLQLVARGSIDSAYAARLDRAVTGATARGVKLILTVAETPCWASSAPDTLKLDCTGAWWDRKVTKYAPTDPADYAWIVNWIAAKYGSQLAAIELWNEPNYVQGDFFNFMAPDIPLAYTRLVQAAYPAIKAVAPTLPVLAGALSFSDDVFLRALYADGIRGSYDGLSTHPYNEGRAPGAAHDVKYYKWDLVQGTDMIRSARAAVGDTTPLWLTEFGYTSCTVGTNSWCVSADQQATYLADATRLVAGWSDVRAFIVYNLRNKGTSATSTESNFGLVTTTYERKPSYAAVSDVFHALAPVPASASASPAETASASAAPTDTPSPTAAPAPSESPSPSASPTETTAPVTSPAPPPIDLTPPAAVSGLAVTGSSGTATVAWTNPTDPDLARVTVVMQAGRTPPTTPTTGTVVASGAMSSAPVAGLSPATAYAFAAFAIDTAGNTAPAATAVLTGTTIATTASGTVVYPALSTVRGRLLDDTGAGVAGQSVVVLQRTAGTTAWVTAGRTTSATDGSVTWSGKTVSTDWQLRFDGGPGSTASASAVVSAPVATSVSVAGSATKLQLNAFLTLSGSVGPNHAGQAVYAEVWNGTTWTQVASGTLSSSSTYSMKFKVATRGAITYRVRKAADADHAAGTSAGVVISVL